MPVLDLVTNVKISDVKAFILELSKLGAEVLEKPEFAIAVTYTYNENMSFAGSFDPTFVLSIVTLNDPDLKSIEKQSKILFDHFHRTLGVQGTRGYVVFNDPGKACIGFKGTTLATILP